MRIRISDEEIRLQKRIIRLTAKGRADEAVRFYENELPFIESARTHYVAFVAACDCHKSDEFLDAIYPRADRCTDIDEARLDFARDRAIRLVEVKPRGKRNAKKALAAIREVMRSRRDDEGQDRSQLSIDELAWCKILIYAGNLSTALRGLERLAIQSDLPAQTVLDVKWWRLIATVKSGMYWEATKMAWRPNDDPKRKRRTLTLVARFPALGPIIVRIVIKLLQGL